MKNLGISVYLNAILLNIVGISLTRLNVGVGWLNVHYRLYPIIVLIMLIATQLFMLVDKKSILLAILASVLVLILSLYPVFVYNGYIMPVILIMIHFSLLSFFIMYKSREFSKKFHKTQALTLSFLLGIVVNISIPNLIFILMSIALLSTLIIGDYFQDAKPDLPNGIIDIYYIISILSLGFSLFNTQVPNPHLYRIGTYIFLMIQGLILISNKLKWNITQLNSKRIYKINRVVLYITFFLAIF